MKRLSCFVFASLIVALLASSAPAQTRTRLRYIFEPGTSLSYKLQHELAIENVVSGNKQEYSSKSESTRVYRVLEISRDRALLELTVTHLRLDATLPDGKRIQVDSATDKDHPLAQLAGKPILRFRVSPTGEISDVERLQPQVQGIDATLQYSFVRLPEGPVNRGDTWSVPIQFTLPPPLGAGKSVELMQRCVVTDIAGAHVTLQVNVDFQSPAEVPARTQAAVAQFLMQGPVLFDVAHGRIQRTDYTIDRIVKGHAGDDSAMTVRGRLTQVLLNDVAQSP